MQPTLELIDLSFSYNPEATQPHFVLENINLQFFPGQIVGLLGKSGAGKTSLMRLISGRISPTTGQVKVAGCPTRSAPGRAASYLQGDTILNSGISLLENMPHKKIEEPLSADDRSLFHALGLDENLNEPLQKLPHTLQDRADVGFALLSSNRVVLLDELPGMQLFTAQALRESLPDRIHVREQCLILATRSPEVVTTLCDRVVVLQSGRVAYMGLVGRTKESEDSPCYRICLEGWLAKNAEAWFPGMRQDYQNGCTSLEGPIVDQPALYGILGRIRDLGLNIRSLTRIAETQEDALHRWMEGSN